MYLKRKHNQRVDVLLVNLLKFSRDQVFERLICLTKGKESTRQHMIHERHLSSKKLDISSVTRLDKGDGIEDFDVRSETQNKLYRITRLAEVCSVRNCAQKCRECNVCAHTFQCMCPDYLIQGTSCKHVHLVKRFLDENNEQTVTLAMETDNQDEIAEVFELVRSEDNDTFQQFNSLSGKVCSQIDSLRTEVKMSSSSDFDAMKQLSKALTAAANTFIAMKKNRHVVTLDIKEKFPPNKNIEVQQKFKSVMKRKQKSRVRLVKPTVHQQTDIISNIAEMRLLFLLGITGDVSDIKPEIIDIDIDLILKTLEKNNLEAAKIQEILREVKSLHEDWICGACKVTKYVDMIECEECLTWYHWSCASKGEVALPSATWLCSLCSKKTAV